MAKISVIIPVYNGEKFLEANYNSFLKQTFKDFNIIYVNDGSCDGTEEILIKLAANKELEIVMITKENGGVSSARNAGLERVTGDYMTFVDVDDEILEHHLQSLYENIVATKADVCFCKSIKSKEQGCYAANCTTINGETSLKDFLYGRLVSGVCTMLIKKSIVFENKIEFAVGYKYSEDLHFVWRILAFSKVVAISDTKSYLYNDVAGSAMSKFDSDRMHSVILIEKLVDFFKENNSFFVAEFEKFAVARMYWSLMWQAAIKLSKKEYINFCKNNKIKEKFLKLKTFPEKKVRLSARIALISIMIFRFLAKKYGKHLIH